MKQAHRWRTAAGLLAASLTFSLALAGCGVTSQTDSGGAGGGDAAPAARGDGFTVDEGAPVAAPTAAPAEQPGEPNQAPGRVQPTQRSIIYRGNMSVRVDNVQDAANRAADVALGLGGLVGADRRTLNEQHSEAQITLRVPADRFEAALDAIAALGTEESRAVQTEDVTETVLDLDVRLASQQASVDRVRALLARAQTIGEVVSVEAELTRREADLASLKTRKERLADLVALSTITVSLLGPDAPSVREEPDTGFIAGLKDGWEGFLTSVQVVLTVAGWLLPWAIAIGLPIWLAIWLLRRRRPALAAAGPAVPLTFGLPPAPPLPGTSPTPPAQPPAPAPAAPPASPQPSASQPDDPDQES
jgi:Domain of unknown function (DUF4349)